MDLGRLKPFAWPAGAAAALLAGFALGLLLRSPAEPLAPNPEAIAATALLSVREQGRIAAHSARFVAIARARRGGLVTAERSLIVPGDVVYEVDLARLSRERLAWDAATATLTVTLPPIEVNGPRIDWAEARAEGDGGILVALAGGESEMDAANRQNAQADLLRQAREEAPLRTARDAAMRLVARSFAMPLRAAGIDASVAVRFVDPAGEEQASYLDRRHPIEDAVRRR
ncbi:DUF4230 domain-containing protein [Sphingosinicella sp.]|uniref:DUF4230 domain-containing protein n=1 Tax=Sphingosinicella sp. TaxID=1917971 RepID=UPI00403824CA